MKEDGVTRAIAFSQVEKKMGKKMEKIKEDGVTRAIAFSQVEKKNGEKMEKMKEDGVTRAIAFSQVDFKKMGEKKEDVVTRGRRKHCFLLPPPLPVSH